MLAPLAEEIGEELFCLLIASSSSEGTAEDYQLMVTQLADNFPDGFHAWGQSVAAAGWGNFILTEFNETEGTARVRIENPWELVMQRKAQGRFWGCPFLMGKIVGIFSQALKRNCWADEIIVEENTVDFRVYQSSKTISEELHQLRMKANDEKRMYLSQQLEYSTRKLRRATETLEEYSRSLEQRVEELRIAQEKANAATEAKTLFLTNMSHEIRTPLNGVMGMFDFLLESGLTPPQRELAETGKECAGNLLSLLGDILDISRIESGEIELNTAPFDLKHELEKIEGIFDLKAQEKGQLLSFQIPSSVPPSFVGDAGRLRQVLSNLLSNAIKFTPPSGSITVRVLCKPSLESGEITLRAEVKDTGIGIPEEKHSQIFDAFTQVESHRTRKFQGAGLGLALTKRLVTLMRGTVGIQSVEEKGSLFWIEIPLQVHQQVSIESPSPTNVPSNVLSTEKLKELRVLVVDDNTVNRKVATKVLTSVGCIVSTAENGLEAVELSEQKPFDIILMDIQMPVMDGFQALHEIRKRKNSPCAHIPIVALTAHALSDTAEECLREGMDGYVSKPINKEQLFSSILKTLERSPTS